MPEWTIPASVVALVGAFAPWVINQLKKKVEADHWRYLIAVGFSIVTGLVSAVVLKVDFTVENISLILTGLFFTSNTAFKMFWQPLAEKRAQKKAEEELGG